jgi:hypothetical protein
MLMAILAIAHLVYMYDAICFVSVLLTLLVCPSEEPEKIFHWGPNPLSNPDARTVLQIRPCPNPLQFIIY